MLEGLDKVPWADLEHAYGTAEDVPDLLRALLDPDPKIRSKTMWTLYGNVFHQGTRYPATPHVIPFLIEMCSGPDVPDRGELLGYWGSLITGYFNTLERPVWGDGKKIHFCGEIQKANPHDPYAKALHDTYRESLKGFNLVCRLLGDPDASIRAHAAFLLACMPTMAKRSAPELRAQLKAESSEWVRASIAFALGEIGAAATLRQLLAKDGARAVRCMAACQLARIEPTPGLVEPLLGFVAEPIEDFDTIPGSGGKSTGVAAYAISQLPAEVQLKAIPAICDRLDQARSFDTMPLVQALLRAAFVERDKPLRELNSLQRYVLVRMLNTEELWSIGNLMEWLRAYGLPTARKQCAKLAQVKVADDESLAELRSALMFAQIGFLDKARDGIDKAMRLDPAVFERSPGPEECWLLCAKAFAETDADRALDAYRKACRLKSTMRQRVDPRWHLADLLKKRKK